MKVTTILKFRKRLLEIGIEITLSSNLPWIYLYSVNGIYVTEKFHSNHGFTAFLASTCISNEYRFADRRKLFKKIRELVNETSNNIT